MSKIKSLHLSDISVDVWIARLIKLGGIIIDEERGYGWRYVVEGGSLHKNSSKMNITKHNNDDNEDDNEDDKDDDKDDKEDDK